MKINREALQRAVKCRTTGVCEFIDIATANIVVDKAAAILFKLTDPEFVPPKNMFKAGFDCEAKRQDCDYVFRAMMKEITE